MRWFSRWNAKARVVVLLLGVGGWLGCASGPEDAEPDLEFSTAEPRYVGDEACESCHGGIYTGFHRTGMGRSMSAYDPATAPERFDGETTVYNEATDLYYTAFVRNDTLFQREERRGADGQVIHERAHPAARVVGSGHAARTYLMEVNGFVTEMPLTWYVERGLWDMSPGYRDANDRFGRKINLECMTCHNSFAGHSAYTQNHYTEIPFGISCERCHGPGGRHVEAREAGYRASADAGDPYIVNPGRLDRATQLSVCQQCHLSGLIVYKPSENPKSFRPGQLLDAHRTVFSPETKVRDPARFGIASHALRLAQSACFDQSDMTCTTCHNPHRPVTDLGEAYFNEVCQSCHLAGGNPTAEAGHDAGLCTRPEATSQAQARTGDCVGCHMQKAGTSDVPHVSFTDHWIRRTLPEPRAPGEAQPFFEDREPLTLLGVVTSNEGVDAVRVEETGGALGHLEAAVAYLQFFETMHRHPAYLRRIIDLARTGLAGGADHVEARIALGRALAELDSLSAAEQALQEAAQRYPRNPWTWFWLGSVQDAAGRSREATVSFLEALRVQPRLLEARVELASNYLKQGRIDEGQVELETILSYDQLHYPKVWHNLGVVRLQRRQLAGAEAAFTRAVELDPDQAESLVQLGTLRLQAGTLDEAATYFQRAVSVDEGSVAAHGSLGLVFAQLGRVQEARRQFRRVLELDPDNPNARAFLEQLGG